LLSDATKEFANSFQSKGNYSFGGTSPFKEIRKLKETDNLFDTKN
jgi:hypothetical protein